MSEVILIRLWTHFIHLLGLRGLKGIFAFNSSEHLGKAQKEDKTLMILIPKKSVIV